jgi:hypothetical protein
MSIGVRFAPERSETPAQGPAAPRGPMTSPISARPRSTVEASDEPGPRPEQRSAEENDDRVVAEVEQGDELGAWI